MFQKVDIFLNQNLHFSAPSTPSPAPPVNPAKPGSLRAPGSPAPPVNPAKPGSLRAQVHPLPSLTYSLGNQGIKKMGGRSPPIVITRSIRFTR